MYNTDVGHGGRGDGGGGGVFYFIFFPNPLSIFSFFHCVGFTLCIVLSVVYKSNVNSGLCSSLIVLTWLCLLLTTMLCPEH